MPFIQMFGVTGVSSPHTESILRRWSPTFSLMVHQLHIASYILATCSSCTQHPTLFSFNAASKYCSCSSVSTLSAVSNECADCTEEERRQFSFGFGFGDHSVKVGSDKDGVSLSGGSKIGNTQFNLGFKFPVGRSLDVKKSIYECSDCTEEEKRQFSFGFGFGDHSVKVGGDKDGVSVSSGSKIGNTQWKLGFKFPVGWKLAVEK